MNNILIVAPHPDDEILGCGGVISKHVKKGDTVYCTVVTNANIGDPNLYSKNSVEKTRKEALLAHKTIGISETIFFDFPAPRLDAYPSYKISIQLAKIINKLNISIMYIPFRGDIHGDHKKIFDAAMVAARPINDCPVKNIYAYETMSETEWAYPFASDYFIPNYFVEISEKNFNDKVEAMKVFKSQLKDFPSSRSIETLDALSKYRGSTIGKFRAESFMIIRKIDD